MAARSVLAPVRLAQSIAQSPGGSPAKYAAIAFFAAAICPRAARVPRRARIASSSAGTSAWLSKTTRTTPSGVAPSASVPTGVPTVVAATLAGSSDDGRLRARLAPARRPLS